MANGIVLNKILLNGLRNSQCIRNALGKSPSNA
jgi:hypothetical protein